MGFVGRFISSRNARRLTAKAELEDARARISALEVELEQLKSERDALTRALNAERAEWEREREASYARELEANTRAYCLAERERAVSGEKCA